VLKWVFNVDKFVLTFILNEVNLYRTVMKLSVMKKETEILQYLGSLILTLHKIRLYGYVVFNFVSNLSNPS
jgi:hypothetical protein